MAIMCNCVKISSLGCVEQNVVQNVPSLTGFLPSYSNHGSIIYDNYDGYDDDNDDNGDDGDDGDHNNDNDDGDDDDDNVFPPPPITRLL